MAARLGLEPRQNESESFVLPLHHRAVENRRAVVDRAFAVNPAHEAAGVEPAMGFEPATACLQNRCSTVELRRRGQTVPSELGVGPGRSNEKERAAQCPKAPADSPNPEGLVAPRGLEPRTY